MTDSSVHGSSNSSGAPERAPRSRLAITPLAAMVASGIALVCSFLPWARVFLFTVNGTDGDGILTAIGSGVALALLAAMTRIASYHVSVAIVAVVGAAVSAATYGFDLARVSRLVNSDEAASSILAGSIDVGFGLVLGAASSGAALIATIVVAAHMRRLPDVRHEHNGWTARQLAVSMLAGATLVVCAAESVWVLSIILAVATGVCWVLFTRPLLFKGVVGALALAAVIGGFGGGALGAVRAADSGASSCDELFVAGGDVDEIAQTVTCEGADGLEIVFTVSYQCYDDSTLYVGDSGWGYGGKAWNLEGDAPISECTTSAEDQCSDLFADGVTTESGWEYLGAECFGPDGTPIQVSMEIDFCEDLSIALSNEYGWGKVGEPWHAAEAAPSSC